MSKIKQAVPSKQAVPGNKEIVFTIEYRVNIGDDIRFQEAMDALQCTGAAKVVDARVEEVSE